MGCLILNVGSSTLRATLFADAPAGTDSNTPLFSATFEKISGGQSRELKWATPTQRNEIETGLWNSSVDRLAHVAHLISRHVPQAEQNISTVGHRIVHGGHQFQKPTIVNDTIKQDLNNLCHLAPLHQPGAIEVLTAAQTVLPKAQHVAIFDTTYFTRMSEEQVVYPVPYDWFEQLGIRRFGFHGISHQWCQHRAAQLLNRDLSDLSVVSCHLGSGCSITASRSGKAVATTMGFTPLDGIMMGTRGGSIDPGILFYMLRDGGLTIDQLDEALHKNSGLRGVSGISSDVRELEAAAASGHHRAVLALNLFADRARSEIARMAVRLGRADILVFTGGIGEHAIAMRERITNNLQMLGWHLDHQRNESLQDEGDIATADSPGRILVIRAREDLAMREAIATLLTDSPSGS